MRREDELNYAGLLGVIAAASFAAPLVAGLGESLGLSDQATSPISLVVAAAIVVAWLVAVRSDKPT